jgi:hypothetical protein
MTNQIRRLFLLFLFAVVAIGCKPAKKNPNVLDGGEIKYSVSGNDRGIVRYAAGVRPQEAEAVGQWLRDKGWFVTREENRSAVSGKAKGSFGTGAAGRAAGSPLARIAPRTNGLEVIVYASAQDAESTDVIEFGAESADELKKQVGKPVRFVIRAETKKGQGVEWVDSYWDSEADQVARSKGR